MMTNKTKYLWGLIAILLVLGLASVTIAFTTRQATANNVLTFGNLKLALRQTTLSPTGEEIPYNEQESFNITTHNTVSRIVRVENVGDHPMYVRIALSMNGTRADGTAFDTDDLVQYNINDTDWVYRDGWYYYRHALEAQQTTRPLLTEVEFDGNGVITAGGPDSSMDLQIDAQAVQSENNAAAVLDASGWPQ